MRERVGIGKGALFECGSEGSTVVDVTLLGLAFGKAGTVEFANDCLERAKLGERCVWVGVTLRR